jgi:hypothetical protein
MATLYVNLITSSDSAVGSQSAPFETIGRVLGLAASGTSFATDEIATATEGKILVNYPAREKLSPARDISRGEISALKKVRYALCPMPYALCPMHVGYLMLLRKAISALIYQTLVATNRAQPINSPYIV